MAGNDGRPLGRIDIAALVGVLVLGGLVRLIGLPARGMWDADQGHDMLVLAAFVQHGAVPLLGPPTSIGGLHHGALYYYLLAPFAALSGANPTAATAGIAASGIASIGVVWWLARSIGGPIAGLVAGLLMAFSAAAIDESTFIWNPNLLDLSSSIAFAAAWQAWRRRDLRWWLVAAAGLGATMQIHVLGAVLVVPFVGLLVADVRRRSPGERGRMVGVALACVAVVAVLYAPLLAYEVGHDFAESRALVAFLTGASASGTSAPNVLVRVVIVAMRVLSWPLSGLITDAPLLAILVATAVVVALAWRLRSAAAVEREAMAWFGATLAWSILVLAVVAPTLATVVPGLPNDHYHAYLDPIVIVIIGVGLARLLTMTLAAESLLRTWPRVLGALGLAALVGFNVWTWPPPVSPDGGWPAAENASREILTTLGNRDFVLLGIPAFKPTDAIGFPLNHLGRPPSPASADDVVDRSTAVVVVCDRLFETVVGAPCGGPAEQAALSGFAPLSLVRRIEVSARTVVSIYAASDAA